MRIALIVSFVILAFNSFSFNIPSKEIVEENIKKNLIVVLKEVNPINTKGMTEEQIKNYSLEIDEYNSIAKSCLVNNWIATSGGISFKMESELSGLEKKNFLFLTSGTVTYFANALSQTKIELYQFDLSYWTGDELSTLTSFAFQAGTVIDEADFIFVAQQNKNHLDAALSGVTNYSSFISAERRERVLIKKTVLIDSDLTNLSQEFLNKKIPYKTSLSKLNKIDESIKDGDDNYAYVRLIYAEKGKSCFYGLFDSKTGELLGVSGLGTVEVYFFVKEPKYTNLSGDYSGYGYMMNSLQYRRELFRKTLYQSKITMKKIHLKTFNLGIQKTNYKFFD